jgi:hypothetical protein
MKFMSSRNSGSPASSPKRVERLDIFEREPPRLGKTLRRIDMEPRIKHREVAGMFVEHRRLVEGLFAFRHFAATIDGNGLEQARQQIRPPRRHHIVHGHRADDRREPAGLGAPQAQQRDNVAHRSIWNRWRSAVA